MDANTKQKTLTGVLTALLLGAAFVGVVPTASAAHATPGANLPDAYINVASSTTATFFGVTQGVNVVTVPTDGVLRYNTTYDLTFTGISVGSGTYGPGYGPAGTQFGMELKTPSGHYVPNPRDAVPDGSGRYNVTFPSQFFNQTGFWTLEAPRGTVVSTFLVQPEASLTVTLSQNTFTYSESNVTFVISVSPLAAGQSATLEGRGIPASTVVTGPTGQYVFSGGLPEVGTFTIYANRSIEGDAAPELTGTTTYTITQSAITVTPVDVAAKAGFDKPAKWNLTYPNGTAVFCPSASTNCGTPLNIVNYNLSVNFSYGTLYANSSSTSPTLCLWTATEGCAAAPPGVTGWAPVFSFDTSGSELGVFSFRPDATWPAGPYSFSLVVNVRGAADSLQEFAGFWSFTPATPAAVNLDLTGVATGYPGPTGSAVTLSNLSVIRTTGNDGPAGSYDLFLTITGSTQAEHPTTLATTAGRNVVDAFGAANISISGDVILHDTLTTGFSYNPTTGVATLSDVTPTRHGGNVVISVTWKGQTTTLTLPIVNGGIMTATPTELVVDTTSTVTFTVRDDFGNPVPDAQVLIWKKPSGSALAALGGATAVNGTGAPGAGQNGQYTLTLTPTSIGKYIAYTQIGREATANSADTRRFSYLELNVVPAHDVNLNVTPTTAMASVTTAYMINASIPDGRSLGTNAIFYMLSEAQRADQIANLSLTTGVAPAVSCSPGQVSTPTGCVSYTTQTNAAGGVTNYFFNATLPSGTWYVYTCGNAAGSPVPAAGCTDARHDNNQSVPTITVNRFRATFTPNQLANNPNIQSNTTVNVTVTDASGAPWNGTLLLNSTTTGRGTLACAVASGTCTGSSAVNSFSVPITNGNGSFVATGLDVGDVTFDFDPLSVGGNTPVANIVDGVLRVVGPNVTVTPDRIPIGKASTITVNVRSLNGTPMVNLSVRMCGTPIGGNDTNPACTGSQQTDAGGNALMGVNPISTGTLTLYVNNVTAGKTVLVYAGLVITFVPSSPNAGDTVTGTVGQVGATGGEPGVTVSVTRNGTAVSGFPQTTGTNGQFVLSNVEAGTYTVTASKPGFQNQTETLVVGSRQTQDDNRSARFELSNLVAPTTAAVGQAMTVTADVRNVGQADGTATVLLLVNGQVRDTRSVPVTAGGRETIAFDFTPAQAGSLRVTVKLATGETLAEKTVTVGQQTTTTTTTQQTTTTTTTTTTVTTTPTPTPRVPGFEVVALLGALAVAMLVLRRRS